MRRGVKARIVKMHLEEGYKESRRLVPCYGGYVRFGKMRGYVVRNCGTREEVLATLDHSLPPGYYIK